MKERRIRLALTIGDPAGIGPEIAAALLSRGGDTGADIALIGAPRPDILPFPAAGDGSITAGALREALSSGSPVLVDTGGGRDVPAGGPSAEGGAVCGEAVETAVRLAGEGAVEGIVTGPISKEALSLAGYDYIGHTDMLADLFDSPDCQMMMVSGSIRIVILTRDIPLSKVPSAVTRERITAGARVTASALRELWGIEDPRIDVAALNPHAGDGGVTGNEEKDVILPAIESLAGEGIDARGPFPADTLFHEPGARGCDAIIALYHDQGMIPFKASGFERGVNMTIGLPVVRTSVCHGTAYDIAGRGEAGSGSLEAAVDLAVRCCRVRNPVRGSAA